MIEFKIQAEAMRDELIARRRDFHRHPELAFKEVRTAGIIAEELNRLGLEVQSGIGKTGVVAILEGALNGPTVLYRADMDALPIQEENEVEYRSEAAGVMHACGHDGHMAIGLGIARIFAEHRDQLAGRIKFVFQPGEEGAGGALAMIRDGVLDDPEPDVSFGIHLWTPMEFGTVGVADGPIMSGSSTFEIEIRGKGGHAAMPHTTVDPIACAGQLITALHTIVGRKMNAMDGAVVLSVTGLKTPTFQHNIIPDYVEIMGTFRTFNALTSELLEQHIRDVSVSLAGSIGCSATVNVRHLTIPVVNNPDVVRRACDAMSGLIEPEHFDTHARTMASEDMSYILEDVPGMFMLVGASNQQRGLMRRHHHPTFDFDEDALPLSVALMCHVIADYVLPGFTRPVPEASLEMPVDNPT